MPLALVFPLETLVSHTVECCLPTHRHPLAIAACVVQNLVLQSLVKGHDWNDALKLLNDRELWKNHADLIPLLKALKGDFWEPGAVDVLSEAIQCVSKAGNSEQAVSAAVRMGGDTDTRAAVAGTFAGALWDGVFPEIWTKECESYAESLKWAQELSVLRDEFACITNKEKVQISCEDVHDT
jgi:ADP-ribosylglycohydrolase